MYDVFYILIFLQVASALVPYIRLRLGGKIISRHTFSKYNKLEMLLSIIFVVAIYSYAEYRFSGFGLYGAFLIAIYMLIANVNTWIDVLVTNKGFYCQGKYSQWQDVVSIYDDNSNNLVIEKESMVRSKQKIKELDNREGFLEIAKMNMTTKS